jgi:hypothetical protein
MSDLAKLFRAQALDLFLDEEDLILLRREAEEFDAAYGQSLDPLVPAVLARLTRSSSVA